MTIALVLLALVLGPPDARGGHAEPARDHGGHALVVPHYWRDLDRLDVDHVRDLPRFTSWRCVHEHEGAWDDSGDPYWGGLQMDRGFMRAYGSDMIRRHAGGLADTWTPAEQIVVAERAYASRGFAPWPNTARACGVL